MPFDLATARPIEAESPQAPASAPAPAPRKRFNLATAQPVVDQTPVANGATATPEPIPPQPVPVSAPAPAAPGFFSGLRDTVSGFIGDQVDTLRQRNSDSVHATSQYIGDYIDRVRGADQHRRDVSGSITGVPALEGYENALGQGETLAQIATGAASVLRASTRAGEPAGAIQSPPIDPATGQPETLAGQYVRLRDQTTYVPRSRSGQAYSEELGALFSPVTDAFQSFGRGVGNVTDFLGAPEQVSDALRTMVPDLAGIAIAPERPSFRGVRVPDFLRGDPLPGEPRGIEPPRAAPGEPPPAEPAPAPGAAPAPPPGAPPRPAPRAAPPPEPAPPAQPTTVPELRQAAKAAYERAEQAGVVIAPERFAVEQQKIAQNLAREGIDPTLHPATTAALARVTQEPGPLTLERAETLRRIAKDAGSTTNPADRRLAGELVEQLDDFMESLAPADITAGDAQAGVGALIEARDLWSRTRKVETIEELVSRAELSAPNFSGSGMENALRTEFRGLAKNARRMRGFTAEEQQAIRRVAQGGPVENVLRMVGKLAPTGIVSATLGGGAGALLSGALGGALAVPAIGAGARYLATRATTRNVDRARELMARGPGARRAAPTTAPLGDALGGYPPQPAPTPPPAAAPPGAAPMPAAAPPAPTPAVPPVGGVPLGDALPPAPAPVREPARPVTEPADMSPRGNRPAEPAYNPPAEAAPAGRSLADELTDYGRVIDNELLVEATRRNGGVTYQPITGHSPEPYKPGAYMVSPYPERGVILDAGQMSVDRVDDFLVANADLLANTDHYFGSWHDTEKTGKVFLDVSIIESTVDKAIETGLRKQQIAYFSFEDMKSHDIDPAMRERWVPPDERAQTDQGNPPRDAGPTDRDAGQGGDDVGGDNQNIRAPVGPPGDSGGAGGAGAEAPSARASGLGDELAPRPERAPPDEPMFERASGLGDELAGDAPAPVFYSALTRAAESAKLNKAPAQQWKATLRNTAGVKPEELEWSGIDAWLDELGRPATKAEVVEYLKANEIQISEVEKGSASKAAIQSVLDEIDSAEGTFADFASGDSDYYSATEPTATRDTFDTEVEIEGETVSLEVEIGRFDSLDWKQGGSLKASVTFPDGRVARTGAEISAAMDVTPYGRDDWPRGGGHQFSEAEHEAIETALGEIELEEGEPQLDKELTEASDNFDNSLQDARRQIDNGDIPRAIEALQDARRIAAHWGDDSQIRSMIEPLEGHGGAKFSEWQTPGGENYKELLLTAPELGKGIEGGSPRRYQSSHFNEDNILAHVRFNERTGADGKRVLFLEEIQSDWHQVGRRQGYAKPLTQSEQARRAELLKRIYDRENPPTPQERAEFSSLVNRAEGAESGAVVPDAPFKTTWPELAFKRMIRYAAENGFDRIAWTPGAVQAERYDLSKQVDSILVHRQTDGEFSYEATRGHDNYVASGTVKDIAALENTIGKDLAKKAAELEPGKSATYTGDDLKVGGGGMVAFYDQMLPSAVNKLVKKWGAKVGRSRLSGPTGGDTVGVATQAVVEGEADVQSVDVTPAMRDAALGGLPMFRKGGERTAKVKSPEVRRVVERTLQAFKTQPPVHVMESFEDLPPKLRTAVTARGGKAEDVRAIQWNGGVYIVADQYGSAGEVRDSVVHEAVAHYGLRTVVDEPTRLKILDGIARDQPEAVNARGKREFGAKYDPSDERMRRIAAEEVLAYETPRHLAGKAVPGKLRQYIEQFIEAVRAFLRRVMGKDGVELPANFGHEQMLSIIEGLEKHLRRGSKAKSGEKLGDSLAGAKQRRGGAKQGLGDQLAP